MHASVNVSHKNKAAYVDLRKGFTTLCSLSDTKVTFLNSHKLNQMVIRIGLHTTTINSQVINWLLSSLPPNWSPDVASQMENTLH